MEHKRKKQWILIIMLLLTVCSVFVVYAGREWMFTNPFKPYTFSSVSYASGDGDGCTYVIDDSNRKILKISADGRLLWRACASDKSFLSAERVVADGDGNVYLHDVRIEHGQNRYFSVIFFYFCTKRWKYDTNDFPGFGRRAQKIFYVEIYFYSSG